VVLCGLENENFIDHLSVKNFEAHHIPLIEAAASQNETHLEDVYSYAVVASKNCVDFLPERMPEISQWIAVGHKTAEYLKKKLNLAHVLVPEINDGLHTAKMAVEISKQIDNFIWFGALNGRKEGIDHLKSSGRNTTVFNGYETRSLPVKIPDSFERKFFLNRTCFWVFTSPSSAKSYFEQNLFNKNHLICVIGNSTAAVFFEKQIVPYYIASISDLDAMAKEIAGEALETKFTLQQWRLS
jgi:uroporphyrinogen-III synthase